MCFNIPPVRYSLDCRVFVPRTGQDLPRRARLPSCEGASERTLAKLKGITLPVPFVMLQKHRVRRNLFVFVAFDAPHIALWWTASAVLFLNTSLTWERVESSAAFWWVRYQNLGQYISFLVGLLYSTAITSTSFCSKFAASLRASARLDLETCISIARRVAWLTCSLANPSTLAQRHCISNSCLTPVAARIRWARSSN